jgi:hypothetical protein
VSTTLSSEKKSETRPRSKVLRERISKTIRTCCCFLEKLPSYFKEFEVEWGASGIKEAWEEVENKKELIEEIDITIDKLITLKRLIRFSTHRFGNDFKI